MPVHLMSTILGFRLIIDHLLRNWQIYSIADDTYNKLTTSKSGINSRAKTIGAEYAVFEENILKEQIPRASLNSFLYQRRILCAILSLLPVS